MRPHSKTISEAGADFKSDLVFGLSRHRRMGLIQHSGLAFLLAF